MDKKVARALRVSRRQYQDGGFTSDTEQDQMRAASDPHRYERFVEPVAKGVQWLKDMVKAPFDMARDAREAGGYSNLDPGEVGRAGLNTGLGALAPAAGLATGALPKGSGFVLSSGGAPSEPKGIRAYHGSPHDFDKFSLEHIGKGEGAQAYGHGLYFAENEGVAKSYRDSLSGDGLGIVARGRLRQFDGDFDKTLDYMRKNNRPNEAGALAELERARAAGVTPGRMYEVHIDADPADFLEWDKPLSQQSEKVRAALKAGAPGYLEKVQPFDKLPPETLGRDAYTRLSRTTGPDWQIGASEELRKQGVPGIRYLDQGSRASGEGSRNIVLFRDDIISIVRKYGIAAAVSMYGADAVTNAMQDAGTP